MALVPQCDDAATAAQPDKNGPVPGICHQFVTIKLIMLAHSSRAWPINLFYT